MKAYFLRHAQMLLFALGQLVRQPAASLMTLSVNAIALALPAGLFLLMENTTRASAAWEARPQISVYLKSTVSENELTGLSDRLLSRADIDEVIYVSAESGLAEFRDLSGFGAALDLLDENPLPAVLTVYPARDATAPEQMSALATEFENLPNVEQVQIDLQWLQRLRSLIQLAQRGLWVVVAFLATGLVLIISNTIRLAILSREDEITIIDLIGGTPAFIRRPFLYSGWLQGLLGGILAWIFLALAYLLLRGPLIRLLELYQSDLHINGPGWRYGFILMVVGASLGWLASRITTERYLRQLSPDAEHSIARKKF
ncbi:MAG: permease-like cell division protein FtsX [Gammaproteobacteria bacterium]|nr:permease-like cell division protein FtsX [Gammaproteobacteria bacterium]